ncbi:MAG: hypothetical protein EOO48_04830 [Flavobacterium sp.]|nr:MAG: hypothetical protein EOO48_04830 [Flavobacterium sp.]
MFTSSIILGFIRLCFMLLVLFYFNRKLVNPSDSNNFLEFVVNQWFKYGSIIGIIVFITVQLNIYDLFNCVILLILVIIIDYIGLKNLLRFRRYVKEVSKKNLHNALKSIELNRPVLSWFAVKKRITSTSNGYFMFFLVAALAGITFGSRYYFFKYDLYSLSGVWIADLQKVIDFDLQIWFLNDTAVNGDFAFINFYAKMANVSPEIALQSMGILESTLLSVLLFWLVRKVTTSKYIGPILAALSFALAYTLTPTNIYFLLQNKPIFLAMAFGLPTMVFLLKPNLLKYRKLNYLISLILVFITIGLIDIFTLYILFPPFMLLAALFTRRKSLRYYWVGALAYVMACAIVLLIYAMICIYFETDLEMFLHSNLISVSSYTYLPQIVVPFKVLIDYYQLSTFVSILLILKFVFYNKDKNWGAALAFLIYFNVLVFLGHITSEWIDRDLLNQALSVFMAVVIGINAAVIIRLFSPVLNKFARFNRVAVIVFLGAILLVAVYYQKDTIATLTEADTTPKQVLDAYDKISTTYFPYSYAVVNDYSAQAISTNKHFFVNYTDFLNDYPAQDSVYFKNIHNPKFFKKHPESVLPKSVLLFVFHGTPDMYGEENGDISDVLMEQLAMLKKRGRKIGVFYKSENVKVYEIVNTANESQIPDLIF